MSTTTDTLRAARGLLVLGGNAAPAVAFLVLAAVIAHGRRQRTVELTGLFR